MSRIIKKINQFSCRTERRIRHDIAADYPGDFFNSVGIFEPCNKSKRPALFNPLFNKQMIVCPCGNLCKVRYADNLKRRLKLFELIADFMSRPSADSRINFIEYQR